MLRSVFLRSAMAFAGVISVVAAAGSSRSEPVPELTKVDEITIRGTILESDDSNLNRRGIP